MPMILCKNLEFNYEGRTVFNNVSFEVNKGDYLCIVGENGSGKTTLINGILGITKQSKGEILLSNELTNRKIGFLPQHTVVQKNFPASVYEVVLSGCVNKLKFPYFYSKKDRKTADRNIELLEISNIKKSSFHNLSGGQQQRVLLARALCATENILLLDEPTVGLDPLVTNSFYEIVNHLNAEHKITVIMVSHDIKNVFQYATHILHLGNKSFFYGTKDDYLKTDLINTLIRGEGNA